MYLRISHQREILHQVCGMKGRVVLVELWKVSTVISHYVIITPLLFGGMIHKYGGKRSHRHDEMTYELGLPYYTLSQVPSNTIGTCKHTFMLGHVNQVSKDRSSHISPRVPINLVFSEGGKKVLEFLDVICFDLDPYLFLLLMDSPWEYHW